MHTTRHNQAGFTLIETLVAILILAMAIGALLTLTAGGFFTIRYAKNDIVASNLLQESLEYIRNTRDSEAQKIVPSSWDQWFDTYRNANCTDPDVGCMVNPYARASTSRVIACDADGTEVCDNLYYFPSDGFYSYAPAADNLFSSLSSGTELQTSFIRTITMEESANGADIVVTATMEWMNGTNKKQTTQSIILTKWNL